MISRENIYYWKCDRESAFEEAGNDNGDSSHLGPFIQKVLESHFGERTFSFKSAHGQGNHMTYVVDRMGTKYFMRLENGLEQDNYMEVEAAVLNRVRSKGVPTPRVYAVDSTRTTVPFTYQIMEYIAYPDLNTLYKKKTLDLLGIANTLGKCIAHWQSLTFDGFGPFNIEILRSEGNLQGIHQSYRDYFFLNLEKHLSFLINNGFFVQREADEIRSAIKANEGLLALDKGCLVHKDLALWNILGNDDAIKSVIDWDDTISGDTMDDISLLACFHSEDVIMEVLNGYKNIVGSLPDDYLGRFWLHLLRNMIVKAVIRVGGDYFSKQDDFFLIDTGLSGTSLEEHTKYRIKTAMKGLLGKAEISEL